MLDIVLTIVHGIVVLLFGVYLSVAFSGVTLNRKNILTSLALCALSGALQIAAYATFTEGIVWKLYPIITHLPLVLFLMIVYRKRLATALTAVFTAYLCCQPAKWFGVLTLSLTGSVPAEYCVRICVLAAVSFVAFMVLAPYLSEIFNKDTRSVCIFGIIPTVYYAFDYATVIYTDFWLDNNRVVAEFLPFFLCIVFVLFCFVYYKEYERKADAQRKEQIIHITLEQQAKEMAAIKRSEQEIRMLRHDMRLFLNNLSLCIKSQDIDEARKMISGFVSNVEATTIQRYCENAAVNYILSDCAAKCSATQIEFTITVEISDLTVDEVMFSSILSNALDNALNAQKDLPETERHIKLMLKHQGSKLLLSVRNSFLNEPIFVDGMPLSNRKGHGYGTQSIRYMTERLGGKCQFTVDKDCFILRVVI